MVTLGYLFSCALGSMDFFYFNTHRIVTNLSAGDFFQAVNSVRAVMGIVLLTALFLVPYAQYLPEKVHNKYLVNE